MEVTVKLQHLKITARKVRLVADLIRNKAADEAEAILRFTPKKASAPMLKLLRSGMAAIKNDKKMDPKDFFVAKLMVNDGPMQDRVFPRSRGRADTIEKRTSHITLVLGQKQETAKTGKGSKAAKK